MVLIWKGQIIAGPASLLIFLRAPFFMQGSTLAGDLMIGNDDIIGICEVSRACHFVNLPGIASYAYSLF